MNSFKTKKKTSSQSRHRFRNQSNNNNNNNNTNNNTSLLGSYNGGVSDDVSCNAIGEEEVRKHRRLRRVRKHNHRKKNSSKEEEESNNKNKENYNNKIDLSYRYDDELDPYDSDPGQSYREHCKKLQGNNSRLSCLRMPPFLKKVGGRSSNHKSNQQEDESSSTSPPSPITSEAEDVLNQVPNTLPHEISRVRYSLRSSIGDGGEKQPTGPNIMDRRELRPNGVALNVSHWSAMGCRSYMEDRYTIEDMGSVQVEISPIDVRTSGDVEVKYSKKGKRRLRMPLSYFGIFDGHGGDKASQYCVDWLSSYIRYDDSFPYDLGYAMKKSFTSIDDDFIGTGYPDGTTACAVSLIGGRRVVCANTGDSRAIIVRKDGSVVRLSRDHKPGLPDETKRITDLGGKVIYWGRWRVEGLLAVSRAIGDASLKPYVTSEPEVCEYDIGTDDWFLILSSDGVWDVLDNEEAAHVIIATSCVMEEGGKLAIDTDRFKWAARNLCDHAKSCGSTDNFSAVVVDLQSCGNPDSISGRYQPNQS